MLRLKAILHPTDFSETASQALWLARSLARDHGAKLVLISVPPPVVPIGEGAYLPPAELSGLLEETRRQLQQLTATITDVPVEAHAVQGSVGPTIVSLADQTQADLIVMGTHGRSGLSRLLMGSVAEYVLSHAGCPVLTIKPSAAARIRAEASLP